MKNKIIFSLSIFCAILFGGLGCAGCGCGVKTQIRFDSKLDTIVLVINSLDNETATVKLLTNENIEKASFVYDNSIISYDISTGKITAVAEGETALKAKLDGVETEISIVVKKNYFGDAFHIDADMSYLLRENGDNPVDFDLVSKLKNDYDSLQNYNMGYEFSVVEGGDIVRLGQNGIVTPLKSGRAKVAITLVSGIKDGEYTYKTEYVYIDVKSPCTMLDLKLLDSAGEDLTYVSEDGGYIKKYILDKSKWYALRISADSQIFYRNNALINEYYYAYDDLTNVLDVDGSSCVRVDSSLNSNLNLVEADGISETFTFYPLKDFCWQVRYKDSAQNSDDIVNSIVLKIHVIDTTKSVMVNSPVPYIEDLEANEDIIMVDDESQEQYIEFTVLGDNIRDNIVIYDPADITVDYDFNVSNIVKVYPKEINKAFSITIKNQYNSDLSKAFVKSYRIWKDWGDEPFAQVDPSVITLVWQVASLEAQSAIITQRYDYSARYHIEVYDGNKNLIQESAWANLFEMQLTNNNFFINLKNSFTIDSLGTYYLKFVASEKLCTDYVQLIVQNAENN